MAEQESKMAEQESQKDAMHQWVVEVVSWEEWLSLVSFFQSKDRAQV